ncbi:AAA family ATPase [Kitasatospora sp. NPDC101157]|uniref:AAA family ATPase n=1 Tax=Kitasatospora sp. NPDC101157 TaxID=3364098 RepID=UPI00382FE8A1
MAVRSLVIGVGGFPKQVVSEEDRANGTTPFAPLPSVAGTVERVAHALGRAGVPAGEPLHDPDVETARSTLARLWQTEDPLVVHFCGHGAIEGDDLYLVVRDSDVADLPATALSSSELIRRVEHSRRVGPTLFLLDVCGGGQALAAQSVLRLSGVRRKAWVIAACAADEAAYGARFSGAAATVLERLAKGLLDLSPELEYVPVDTLAMEIDRELRRTAGTGDSGQTVVRTPHDEAVLQPPAFFLNPGYSEDLADRFLTRTDAALRQFAVDSDPGLDVLHFVSRAVGTTRADGCLFSGRGEQLIRIETWLNDVDDDQGRLLVVTGGPGSGKSALLGVAVCLTHPALAAVRERVLSRVHDFRPRPEARILAVHARQLTTREVVESLLGQLDGPTADDAGETRSTRGLVERLRSAGPVVLVLDALDEAADPRGLVRELLLPLSGFGPDDNAPECRVVIGTRPWWDLLAELRDAATEAGGALLDLDAQSRDDLARDLGQYLTDLLYPRHSPATAMAAAHRLAHGAEHGAFLIAALYADHLLSAPLDTPAADANAGADDDAGDQPGTPEPPCELTEMFDLHVARLAATTPWIGRVLAVLGHAQGQGMPLDLIHAVASALARADGDPVRPSSVQDTREALTQAAFYLRTATDSDGRLLYRYFHQALTDHTARPEHAVTVHRALLDTVPPGAETTPDWGFASPYLLRHLATHAAAAGRIDELLPDTEFVVRAHPDALLPALNTARADHGRLVRAVYLASADRHRDGPVDERRFLLALDALRYRAGSLHRELCHGLAWRPRWATGMQTSPQLEASLGHPVGLDSVATTVVDGRPVAVSAGWDGSLRVWDLASDRQRALPGGHRTIVPAIACAEVDGRPVAVTVGWDNKVRIWDLSTCTERAVLTGHTNWVVTVACTVVDGRPIAVTGSWDRWVRMWDLSTGKRLARIRAATEYGHVVAVACTEIDGEPFAVIAPYHERMLMWNLTTREVRPFGPDDPRVSAVACTVVGGRPVAVTGAWFGDVWVWDLETGEPQALLSGHTDHVEAVACTTVDGTPIAVTGSNDGSVRVWDLAACEPRVELGGHNDDVGGVAFAVMDGLPVAVTASRDRALRVWDLTSRAEPTGQRGHSDTVRATVLSEIEGTPVVLSGGSDGTVRVWDLATGAQRAVLEGQETSLWALASAVVDGRTIAVSGGIFGDAWSWNLASGTRRAVLPRTARGMVDAAACTTIDGRAIVVLGSRDGWLNAWDLRTGEPVADFPDHRQRVDAVACTVLDGRPVAVTCSVDGDLRICDLVTAEHSIIANEVGWLRSVACVDLDGRPMAVTAGPDGTARVWDLGTRTERALLVGHTGRVTAVACTTVAGRPVAVTGSSDRTVRVWDLTTCETVAMLPQPADVESVAVAPDGTVVVGSGWEVIVVDPREHWFAE